MQFADILRKYRSESNSERDKGTKFEELMARYFMTDPAYSIQLQWCRLWNDFHYRDQFGGQDTGIDLVAKTKSGEYWAIQCKCYFKAYSVTKEDMDTFLATSSRTFVDDSGERRQFSLRLIVATTDNWSKNAEQVINNQFIPTTRLGLSTLEEAPVNWSSIEEGAHGHSARKKKYDLRPHQVIAFKKAMEHYAENDRGKMIMACGTGKTFTSLRIAEGIIERDVPQNRDHPGLILFLAPSISLVGQTFREWVANAEKDISPICVCSDTTVTTKKTEDFFGERVEDLGLPATTDPVRIMDYYGKSKGLTVIFSTYQSITAIIEAQNKGLPEFDLVVCDEAHRTTGVILSSEDESNFTRVHDNNQLKAKKRLYMTATPRLYGEKGKADAKKAAVELCSMDDETKYGKEFYTISFGNAVELELLTDYKVLILTTSSKDIPDIIKRHWTERIGEIDADTNCKIWGCLNALAKNVLQDETLKNTDPEPMKSAVAFCRSIKVSKGVCDLFNDMAADPTSPRKLHMRHIDGSMSSVVRDGLISWLKEDSEECHVLSNVRCLSEGVDVPALDAVMFLDSKGSLVDVVQSVGRVMRRAPGKKYGYIIIPIVVPDDEDPESALDNNDRYKVVWDVLRALRSHDERLEAEINTFNLRSDKSGGHVIIDRPGGGSDAWNDDLPRPNLVDGKYTMEDFGNALMARLVLKVGDREYIENWAKKVAEITPAITAKLNELCREGDGYKDDFNHYLKGIRACVNNDVTADQGIDMLVQQIVTKPIFEKLFAKDGFAMQNSVSGYIDKMLSKIHAEEGLADIQGKLDEFYHSVGVTLNGIDTTEGKQKVITALYEKFFKNAFPKDQAINGVVYTPQEIVDFIIHSCVEALQQEFGVDINDEGVNVLDPFTGTGTFIARLMESGVITPQNLGRKYQNELFANEITMLAYYIATVNIENTFQRLTGSNVYMPFDNILLTDTFNIDEICKLFGTQTTLDQTEYFVRNKGRIKREHDAPITIIMGNPPYGANQKSGNDNAKKRKYDSGIDLRIKDTYLNPKLFTSHKMPSSVYDNYIRAFRWASDRLGDNDGIIAFVTPSGWLTGSAFEGFRKTIESEFSKIYVFNLRGDKGTTDEMRRIEGRNVFEYSSDRGGCTVSVSITMLVKRRDYPDRAQIFYSDMATFGDRLKGYEKREIIANSKSFFSMPEEKIDVLVPKSNGDWIVQRNDAFQSLIPLAGDTHKKFSKHCEDTIFVGYSRGYATSRDAWMYNFSPSCCLDNMHTFIDEYSRQTNSQVIEYNDRKIKWSHWLEDYSKRGHPICFDDSKIVSSLYRPFTKQYYYKDDSICNSPAQMNFLYPRDNGNMTICVAGIGVKKDFSCLMTSSHTDLEIVGKSQCFPLYWYDVEDIDSDSSQTKLFESEGRNGVCHNGISNFALKEAQKKYGSNVTKEDIFYYIYGYLHSPDYRAAFSDDLKLSLPRIGFVDYIEDYQKFLQAGRELAYLHTHYEETELYKDVIIEGYPSIESILDREDLHRVTKMRLYPEERKLVYNEYISITNIPDDAFRYIVNGRSALGWIVDQYQYTVDKESGIINDPNEYAGSTYILKLVLSIINVSVRTMEIVDNLPKLLFEAHDDS